MHKIGSNKDFLMNFFLLAYCFAKEPTVKQTENIATKFIGMIPHSDWKGEKHQKLSTVGSSFDLNVSSQEVKDIV